MKKGILLLVDDEPLLLKRLKQNLSDLADEIMTAENGLEAMKILNQELIHCIVCDINMPKMNGVEVIKEFRKSGKKTPFIFYTGHGCQELMLEAVKYGAFDFLDKPNFEGLEDAVSRGLKLGLNPESKEESMPKHLNEYQKLLKEIE